jgi:predicted short-subunit dehydrogenase-like oxidoreductase (DUF2520 family)
MRLIIVGPGRAGGALALAAASAGHEIAGVLARSASDRYGPSIPIDASFPDADLCLICVKDGQVEEVVEQLASQDRLVPVIAHISGFLPVTILQPLSGIASIGGFHPLQTLPDPERGAAALAGSHVGIDGDELAYDTLTHFGLSLAMIPFRLRDEVRPLYHAAAVAASNFVVTALASSSDLLEAANLDPTVTGPLVEQVVRNVFEDGARAALTGPIARGDTETVIGHLVAAREVSEPVGHQFRLLAEATAILAGRYGEVEKWR